MSLSQGCYRDRFKYLEIFDVTNKIASQGEANYFVDGFLSIIVTGQEKTYENLVQKSDLLTKIVGKITEDTNLINEYEKNIMRIMAQDYHFSSSSEGIGVSELMETFDYTDETIRKKLKELYEKGLLEKTKGRPVKYRISKNYLET